MINLVGTQSDSFSWVYIIAWAKNHSVRALFKSIPSRRWIRWTIPCGVKMSLAQITTVSVFRCTPHRTPVFISLDQCWSDHGCRLSMRNSEAKLSTSRMCESTDLQSCHIFVDCCELVASKNFAIRSSMNNELAGWLVGGNHWKQLASSQRSRSSPLPP